MTRRSKSRWPQTPLQFDQLESRITPTALFVNTQVVRYLDLDGDIVQIKTSPGIFTDEPTADSILTFADNTNTDIAGAFEGDDPPDSDPGYLKLMDLTALVSPPTSLTITITVVKKVGDGLAEVGKIDSTILLQRVVVFGRLWEIDCTDEVRSLTVNFLGTGELATENADDFGGLVSESNINGLGLANFGVLKNVDNAFLNVAGDLRKAVILGNVGVDPLVGGTDSSDDTSAIKATNIGFIQIRNNLYGGTGLRSGSIQADSITSANIRGSIIGWTGDNSGWIRSGGTILHAGIDGSVLGGDGLGSGQVSADNNIKSVLVGGNIVGGAGDESGQCVSDNDGIDLVRTGGSLIGGGGLNSGQVSVLSLIKNARIGKDIQGSAADFTGYITADTITNLVVGGSIIGDDGENSGSVAVTTDLKSALVGKNITGGLGEKSGSISSTGTLSSKVTVKNNVQGGDGENSGAIFTDGGSINSVRISGGLFGGDGDTSGTVRSGASIGSVEVQNSIVGGAGLESGEVFATTDILTSIKITGNLVGGVGADSGRIFATGAIQFVIIFGDIEGGFIHSDSTINRIDITGNLKGGVNFPLAGSITALGTITRIDIDGSIVAGTADNSGVIDSGADIELVTVGAFIDGSMGRSLNSTVQVGAGSARVSAVGNINRILIAGSIVGGNNNDTGKVQADSDGNDDGDIGTIIVGNSIVGGNSFGGIAGQSVINSGCVFAHNIGDDGGPNANDGAIVKGGIIGGINGGAELINSGAIRATNVIDRVLIAQDMRGNGLTRVTVSALAELTQITIGGEIAHGDILVGYGINVYTFYQPNGEVDGANRPVNGPVLLDGLTGFAMDTGDPEQFNGTATLGTLVVKSNWRHSNLLVSVDQGADQVVGSDDDLTNNGTIQDATLNGFKKGVMGLSAQTFCIAAANIQSLRGNPVGSSKLPFTETDATDISVNPPFNVLTHADLDYNVDLIYVLLYT